MRSVAPAGSVRLKLFYKVLPTISAFFRRRRMSRLIEAVKIRSGMRVLDLGGTPAIWEHVSVPLEITLLNLTIAPGTSEILRSPSLEHHTFHVVEGDACNVTQYGDRSFDVVFSNSVIEHVGPPAKQAEFAREVLRLGRSYWVQTPSMWFPLEVHSGMPFYWFYPRWLRTALIRSWRARLPAWWADYIETTRVLSRRRMAELFPNGRTRVDYFFCFPKSYVSYFTGP
ncbi:MAG TPA: methyltransferase domain-containing protein [Candidatus Margulisiibacteriota bacterium]|nr:methyltransferase domain-containing protein [Candidatus Margulisiibacteriota bacterium]